MTITTGSTPKALFGGTTKQSTTGGKKVRYPKRTNMLNIPPLSKIPSPPVRKGGTARKK
jgi:hypothetical protein